MTPAPVPQVVVPDRSHGAYGALRLLPGDDLLAGLAKARNSMGVTAACVISCVGSLSHVTLRFADRPEGTHIPGPLEIQSLAGTLDPTGHHLHAVVSDADGRVRGGHLMPDCPVRTTAEIVILILPDLTFGRAPCPLSGYRELSISSTHPTRGDA